MSLCEKSMVNTPMLAVSNRTRWAGSRYLCALCPHISTEVVAESIFDEKYNLTSIFLLNPTLAAMPIADLAALVKLVLPDAAVTLWNDFDGSLDTLIAGMNQGDLFIVHVRVDPSTGKLVSRDIFNDKPANHFAVVKSISNQGVEIVNPFNNAIEQYTFQEFRNTYSTLRIQVEPGFSKEISEMIKGIH